ncbi:predicted protein [Naegleria gruberi]|uniref:Predicted protein n=1 Tax=Naegleria gruberi TaxID=5762 RepID=D2VNQ1_NAEGR|nr:uncharacterized protein NAEGRDRAFT_70577 [Naegleria gruberi]EFC41541.1 predicted protein [Naegleria gruberi]|eukprot:XP_002674285.1 predicted protein [Naegleria gruberi strain NEG-M]
MYQDALFEIFTFGMPNAVFLVYSLVCKEWNFLIKHKKFLQNYHQQVSKGINELLNPKQIEDRMFSCWLEFISHSHPAEYEMGMLLKRSLIYEFNDGKDEAEEEEEEEEINKQTNRLKEFKFPSSLMSDIRFSLIDYKGDRVSLFISELLDDYSSYIRMRVCLNEEKNEIMADHLVHDMCRVDEKYLDGKLMLNVPWFGKSLRNYVQVFSERVMLNMFEGFTRAILNVPCNKRDLRLKSKAFASFFGTAFFDPFIQKVDRAIQSVAERNILLVKAVKSNNSSLSYKLLDMGYTLKSIEELEECCIVVPTFLKKGHLEFLLEYSERFGLEYKPLIERNLRKLIRSGWEILMFLIERGLISNKYLFFVLNTETGEPYFEKIDEFKISFPDIICPFDIRCKEMENEFYGRKFLILFHNSYSELYSRDYMIDFTSKYPSIDIELMKIPRRLIRSKDSKRILSNQLKSYDHVIYYFDEIEFKNRDHYLGLISKNAHWMQSVGIPFSFALSSNNLISLQFVMQLTFSFDNSKIAIMTDDYEASYARLHNLLQCSLSA